MRSPAAVGLVTLLVATAAAVTTEILPVGLLPQMAASLRVPESAAGLLVTLYAVLVAVLAVPLTLLTRRLPRKPLLLGTIGLFALSNLALSIAPSFAAVAAGRALGGVAHAVFFSVANAYATVLVPPERHGRAIAVVLAGGPIGYVASVPLATALGAAVGWRASFAAVGALFVVLLAVVAVLLPARDTSTQVGAKHGGVRRGLAVVGTGNALGFLAHYVLYTYITLLLLGAGVPLAAISVVLFLLAGAGLLGLVIASRVIDLRPRAGLMMTLLIGAAGVLLLVPVGGSPVATVLVASLWILAFGALPPFFAAATIRVAPGTPDLAAAVNNAMSNLGIAAGAAAGALLVTGPGLGALAPVSAVCFVLTALLVLWSRGAFPARVPDARR